MYLFVPFSEKIPSSNLIIISMYMYTYPHHNDDCVYVWGGNFNIAPTSVIHIEASSMLQSLALHSAPDVSPM